MAETKTFPEGIRCFKKHDKAPDFVLGTMVVTPNQLVTWLKSNSNLLTDYKGEKQLRLQILSGKDGPYVCVDTYKPKEKVEDSSLPF
jgi:hypothetical protein